MQFLILTEWLYVTADLTEFETLRWNRGLRHPQSGLQRLIEPCSAVSPHHTVLLGTLNRLSPFWRKRLHVRRPLLSLFLCHSCSLVSLSSPRLARSVPFVFFPILTTSSLTFFTRSLDPPSRLFLKHFPHPLHVCLLVLPFQVHLPFSPHFNALCALHIITPPFLSIIASVPPPALSETMSVDTPQPLSAVIFIPLVQLYFVMYPQDVCLHTYTTRPPALLYCFPCLSLLSAHTGDLLLFLEERMKKSQYDRKYARMKKIKICSSSPPPPPLSLSISASYLLSPAFPVPSFSFLIFFPVISYSLTNAALMMYLCCLSL